MSDRQAIRRGRLVLTAVTGLGWAGDSGEEAQRLFFCPVEVVWAAEEETKKKEYCMMALGQKEEQPLHDAMQLWCQLVIL